VTNRCLRPVICAALTCCSASAAYAVPVTWQLNDFNFTSGGTATGTYTYDAASNTYSDINIVVADIPGVAFPDLLGSYQSLEPGFSASSATAFFIGNFPASSGTLRGIFAFPGMTDAGGTLPLLGGALFVPALGPGAGYSTLPGISISSIPEPTSLALGVYGLLILGRRRADAGRSRSTTATRTATTARTR
jgi:hypothetical protein